MLNPWVWEGLASSDEEDFIDPSHIPFRVDGNETRSGKSYIRPGLINRGRSVRPENAPSQKRTMKKKVKRIRYLDSTRKMKWLNVGETSRQERVLKGNPKTGRMTGNISTKKNFDCDLKTGFSGESIYEKMITEGGSDTDSKADIFHSSELGSSCYKERKNAKNYDTTSNMMVLTDKQRNSNKVKIFHTPYSEALKNNRIYPFTFSAVDKKKPVSQDPRPDRKSYMYLPLEPYRNACISASGVSKSLVYHLRDPTVDVPKDANYIVLGNKETEISDDLFNLIHTSF